MVSQEQSISFSTEEGRKILLAEWQNRRLDEGVIIPQKLYTVQERAALLEDWLRTLIAEGKLDPHRRLPPYTILGEPPFNLNEKDVAQVICELRSKGLLPPRKARIDKGQPQWTPRDNYCLNWIGHMRAIRYDQLQRLLARESAFETNDPRALSASRTSQIIQRWVQAKYAIYRRVYAKQPGWIYLSRKGMFHAGLPYRAEPPKDRLLQHLYYINEVRLALEEEDSSLRWVSERAIQALQEKRQKGQRLRHIPDGILVCGEEQIDIEVQISRIAQEVVEQVLRGNHWQNTNALHYYIGRESKTVVQRAYREVAQSGLTNRKHIEIIDLEAFLRIPAEGAIE
jgi:hypothetical protein